MNTTILQLTLVSLTLCTASLLPMEINSNKEVSTVPIQFYVEHPIRKPKQDMRIVSIKSIPEKNRKKIWLPCYK